MTWTSRKLLNDNAGTAGAARRVVAAPPTPGGAGATDCDGMPLFRWRGWPCSPGNSGGSCGLAHHPYRIGISRPEAAAEPHVEMIMNKFLALALSLSVLGAPLALFDGSGSEAQARLKHTQRKCTTNHVTGMTACTTIVWYTGT